MPWDHEHGHFGACEAGSYDPGCGGRPHVCAPDCPLFEGYGVTGYPSGEAELQDLVEEGYGNSDEAKELRRRIKAKADEARAAVMWAAGLLPDGPSTLAEAQAHLRSFAIQVKGDKTQ